MTRQPSLFRGTGLPPRLKPAFDAFWKAYPPRRPNPRALAEAAFAGAVQAGHDPETIRLAAIAYAAEVKRESIAPAFVVHAATFLRQGRFLDYAPSPAPADAAPRGATPDHPLWPLIGSTMPAHEFNAWIGKCRVDGFESGEVLVLEAPSAFLRDHIRREYATLLRGLARMVVIRAKGDPTR